MPQRGAGDPQVHLILNERFQQIHQNPQVRQSQAQRVTTVRKNCNPRGTQRRIPESAVRRLP